MKKGVLYLGGGRYTRSIRNTRVYIDMLVKSDYRGLAKRQNEKKWIQPELFPEIKELSLLFERLNLPFPVEGVDLSCKSSPITRPGLQASHTI